MFKRSCSLLGSQPMVDVAKWLSGIETVIFGTEGLLWKEKKRMESALEVFNLIKSKGKRILIVSNETNLSRLQMLAKIKCMGFKIDEKDVLSPEDAIVGYLKDQDFKKKVLVCGSEPLVEKMSAAGFCTEIDNPVPEGELALDITRNVKIDKAVGAVLLGQDFDLGSKKMILACNYLLNPDIIYLATTANRYVECGKYRLIDAGTLMDAMYTIVVRKPKILGKPNPRILGNLLKSGEIKPEKTLVVGKSLKSDILFANVCGFHSLLIGCEDGKLKRIKKFMKENKEDTNRLIPDTFLFTLAPFQDILCAVSEV
ncbi:hypothetical protein KR018_010957 [Drosophila ironensis]|nr:hypothetical protein KR018_010957 [Drosophila ironensis]